MMDVKDAARKLYRRLFNEHGRLSFRGVALSSHALIYIQKQLPERQAMEIVQIYVACLEVIIAGTYKQFVDSGIKTVIEGCDSAHAADLPVVFSYVMGDCYFYMACQNDIFNTNLWNEYDEYKLEQYK